jgi:hypothetical protein
MPRKSSLKDRELAQPSALCVASCADARQDEKMGTLARVGILAAPSGDPGERLVPIFSDFESQLQADFEIAPEVFGFVLNRYREHGSLNTCLRRIIQRAGLTPWPRTPRNLRASPYLFAPSPKYRPRRF